MIAKQLRPTFLTRTILLSLLLTSSHAAEPPTVEERNHEATDEIKSTEDGSILKRRVWLDTEWNQFRNGSSVLDETFGWHWAWPVSRIQDWDVRLKIPFREHTGPDQSGNPHEQGLGDIEIASGTAFRLGKDWRAGGGLELHTPSGSLDVLSDNTWRIQEYASIAWDPTPWLTISPSIEYNQSFIEERGASRRHYLETYFPVAFLLPNHWSLAARYEAKVDFEAGNEATHSARVSVNKLFERIPLNAGISFEKPLNSDVKEYQVNLVFTYYFSSRKEKLTHRILRKIFRTDDDNE